MSVLCATSFLTKILLLCMVRFSVRTLAKPEPDHYDQTDGPVHGSVLGPRNLLENWTELDLSITSQRDHRLACAYHEMLTAGVLWVHKLLSVFYSRVWRSREAPHDCDG
ncbi:hypothetical protein EDB19DRAFT_1764159 [Suillus lakei]|nr:hypothetical protein EDB19DRAFT_1764159 [Suillus lakei]